MWPVALDRAAGGGGGKRKSWKLKRGYKEIVDKKLKNSFTKMKRWASIKMEQLKQICHKESNHETHTHTSSCKSTFESAFVCSRPPLSLHW
jgi:hypothetical protein